MRSILSNSGHLDKSIEQLKDYININREAKPSELEPKIKIDFLLKNLCAQNVNLAIIPLKCAFCDLYISSNEPVISFTCKCTQVTHISCLKEKVLTLSPGLIENDINIQCKKCKKSIEWKIIKKCFAPKKKKSFCSFCTEIIKISETSFKCDECLQGLHIKCLKDFIMNLLNSSNLFKTGKHLDSLNDKVICPACKLSLNLNSILDIFSENEKKNILEQIENLETIKRILKEQIEEKEFQTKNKKEECGICGSMKKIETDFITLDCDHRFCSECLIEFVCLKIDECKCSDSDIACPTCKKPISTHVLNYILPKDKYLKYDEFLLQHNPSESDSKREEKIAKCPMSKCNFFAMVDKNSSQSHLFCEVCKQDFCVNGCMKPHIGIKCDEVKNIENDENFQELAKEKYKKCPKCQSWIEKSKGCNHMTCKCGEEFCYVCGTEKWKECGHKYQGVERFCIIF